MIIPATASRFSRSARDPGRDRPAHPGRVAGRRPHDKRRAGPPRRYHRAALPAPGSPAGGSGIIRGYHADTDPQKLGWEIVFFAVVGLDSQKESILTAFESEVAQWPEVRECHMIRGGGDFLLRLVARDTAHENRLTEKLTGLASVSRVQTLQTIRTSRSLAGVPL